ncbi:hypothetical protein NW801_21930 [Brevibacillus laterosporus]|uniref:Uncharacterized protein n=1 Tax=Brevibacillus halotolerans TaxID=1507437 RepID=A0ABT4I3V5_9BACL|nr:MULTISPECIES: hypothetical protein [Brevibacillus]MCR8987652.1 hypothetical protein [Brevibacillus laterosporus]MCZ0833391.1 hypothetical protein [Brevibacillus halotolerans]
MARGGKREGAGRKATGVTKKVSLTLSEKEWSYIDSLDMKMVTFIKEAIAERQSSKNDISTNWDLYRTVSDRSEKWSFKWGVLEARIKMAIKEFQELNSESIPSRPLYKRAIELEKRLECASKYLETSYFFQDLDELADDYFVSFEQQNKVD